MTGNKSQNYVMFDCWKKAQLRFLERKIFSMFRKLQESFVCEVLKIKFFMLVVITVTFKRRARSYFIKRLTKRL